MCWRGLAWSRRGLAWRLTLIEVSAGIHAGSSAVVFTVVDACCAAVHARPPVAACVLLVCVCVCVCVGARALIYMCVTHYI